MDSLREIPVRRSCEVTGTAALVVATGIFIATYIAIMTEKVNRAVIALLGAAIAIFAGIQSQADAFKGST